MYDELWVGAKCMYKLEPVVADGGTLIIYAPHITEVAVMHDAADPARSATTPATTSWPQWDRFKHYPWGVLAHSTHVKGIGTYEDGVETPAHRGDPGHRHPRGDLPRDQPGLPGPRLHRRGRLRRTARTKASCTSPRPARCSTAGKTPRPNSGGRVKKSTWPQRGTKRHGAAFGRNQRGLNHRWTQIHTDGKGFERYALPPEVDSRVAKPWVHSIGATPWRSLYNNWVRMSLVMCQAGIDFA